MRQANIKKRVKVNTNKGIGYIDSIGLTEHGAVRISVYIESEKYWCSYILKNGLNDLLSNTELKLTEESESKI